MNAATLPTDRPVYLVDPSTEFRGYVETTARGYRLMCTTFGRDIPEREARAELITACLNACVGMVDPVAEVAELRKKAEEFDRFSQGMALLAAQVFQAGNPSPPDFCPDPGPAPYMVVDQWPAPMMYLTCDGAWEDCPDKGARFLAYDDALDWADSSGGEIVPSVEVLR